MNTRIGNLERVENTQKHAAANTAYQHVIISLPSGKTRSLLFTEREIDDAYLRAIRNTEDLQKLSLFRRLFR